MQRRDFLKSGAALALATKLGAGKAHASVPAHNWINTALEPATAGLNLQSARRD